MWAKLLSEALCWAMGAASWFHLSALGVCQALSDAVCWVMGAAAGHICMLGVYAEQLSMQWAR